MSTVGMTLTSREGTSWRFDAGTLFAEFLLTGGPGELARFDALAEPADLAVWAQASRLAIDPESMTVSSIDVTDARLLRDGLWRVARCVIAGTTFDDGTPFDNDLDVVNRAAAGPPLVPQLDRRGRSGWLLPTTGSAVLSCVARDAIGVLTAPTGHRLRECAADDCQLIFLDTSRPGTRRWCSMERCGNRHKIRAMRLRSTSVTTQQESMREGKGQ